MFRYLLVGGWNTLFGIGIYALLYWLLGKEVNYLVLAIPANILAVTNAFFCYKFIVFKTKGNILREYFRCYLVYGSSMLLGLAGLYILVDWLHLHPVLANVLLTGITVVISYFGHRFFSFKPRSEND